ncbi:hypothetical protein LELG_03176 [Lodderomyces elongisporus NRRL YB-4239]|uniref:Uncharacterized protein n=1 Tax=Lodderomyces elongisporus (strain ATCC 11503 / CBS 2605 / JCM 1781 / NBRC 1676 / NRRL YB-4239) TaxID=379508 RepID=A5E0N9_LODEL|nr:hypothetical protein LELG_03176 [Lodderomyces elongisporus NRRL YB-4239]
MPPSDSNRYNKKRKRPLYDRPGSSSPILKSTSPLNDTYIPVQLPQQTSIHLTHKNAILQAPTAKSSVDEQKVIQFLSKIEAKLQRISKNSESQISIVISSSEADIILRPLLKPVLKLLLLLLLQESLKDILLGPSFQLRDIVISKQIPGAIDRILTLYGTCTSIALSVAYIVYLLNAKINNLHLEVFTLKSSNYKLHLLLKDGAEAVHGIKYLDLAPLTYPLYDLLESRAETEAGTEAETGLETQSKSESKSKAGLVFDVFLQGDLQAIFNFVFVCFEKKLIADCSKQIINPAFGIHLDPALKSLTSENEELKRESLDKLLKFLYSDLKLKNIL